MVESVKSMIKSWETIVENDGGQSELNVDSYFRTLSADIISKAWVFKLSCPKKTLVFLGSGIYISIYMGDVILFDLEKKSYAMHTLTMKPFTLLSV